MLGNDFRCFYSGRSYEAAVGHCGDESGDVALLDDLEEFVGGVAGEASDGEAGVAQGDMAFGQQLFYFVEAVAGEVGCQQCVFVAFEDEAHDAPEVVDSVGVVEVHRPAAARRRKGADEQDDGAVGSKGLPRVVFNGLFHSMSDNYLRPKSAGISPHSSVFHFRMGFITVCVASQASARAIMSRRGALAAVGVRFVLAFFLRTQLWPVRESE